MGRKTVYGVLKCRGKAGGGLEVEGERGGERWVMSFSAGTELGDCIPYQPLPYNESSEK